MKTNDYIKYVTQQFVSYVDTSSEERKAQKVERKANKLPFTYRWFGLIPFAIIQAFNVNRKKSK
ncbi:YqzE family protein [Anaerobacillus alkalidiazotrophicus]|uniref:YqzE family protein n=1 Tax=Anaerobacillus alkalidiazotrophicus TaxID=472963 RepID=A0A1S2M6F4_9BACI|nr:YqzE family protein [Anaerobacillus alkalidiazotrophicus]OIJ20281.1 YqzE family protein [Anaerobacillus alkalidiazotrophicus]